MTDSSHQTWAQMVGQYKAIGMITRREVEEQSLEFKRELDTPIQLFGTTVHRVQCRIDSLDANPLVEPTLVVKLVAAVPWSSDDLASMIRSAIDGARICTYDPKTNQLHHEDECAYVPEEIRTVIEEFFNQAVK
jgi:hypothetical protein